MNRKNILSIFLIFMTLLYYLPVLNLPLAPYDEAVILVGAEKVLTGEVPHRDFSSEYPPGQFYTLAFFFKAFGTSVITERVYDLLVKSLLSLVIFLIVRSLSSTAAAVSGWIMSLVWVQHSSFPVYPVYPSMLFIFIGAYFVLIHLKEQKNRYVVFSALSIVCALLFRHDLGGYAAIVITLFFLFRRLMKRQSWSPLVIFATGGISAGIPVLVYFVMYSSLEILFDDLVLIPSAFLEKQALPYPSLSRWNLPFYVFPAVLVAGAVASLVLIKRDRDDWKAYSMLLISFIGIVCFNQARIRSDIIHLLPVALTGILLAPVLLHALSGTLPLSRRQRKAAALVFLVVFGITLSKPVSVIMRLLKHTNGYTMEVMTPAIERARYSRIDPDLRDTVAYVKNNTARSDKIYVGVKNHDLFVFNDVVIYFLAERKSATRYHVLNPGVHTTRKVQEAMIEEFRNSPPRLIVLVPRDRYEPNLSSVDSHVDLLDDFIAASFTLTKKFGMYEIWMKNSASKV